MKDASSQQPQRSEICYGGQPIHIHQRSGEVCTITKEDEGQVGSVASKEVRGYAVRSGLLATPKPPPQIMLLDAYQREYLAISPLFD